jgi:hypothetical protein
MPFLENTQSASCHFYLHNDRTGIALPVYTKSKFYFISYQFKWGEGLYCDVHAAE